MTTTRAQIASHSRAAFYLQLRAAPYSPTARAAWAASLKRLGNYQEAAEASRAAEDSLSALWESLGKVEPKRFGPEGQALQAARDTARAARSALSRASAYRGQGGRAYVGSWQPSQPGFFYAENPDSLFRDYADAAPGHRGATGYYCDPYQENTATPVIGQLPGRKGLARYVSGYRFTDQEGATFDLTEIHESESESSWDSPDAKAEAERAAHNLAERAAEKESEYQTAWQAGSQWAEAGESIERDKAEIRALLAERKAARAVAVCLPPMPATCQHLARAVSLLWADIQEARQTRAALAQGQAESLWWSWSRYDESGLSAFAEGAGITTEAARGLCS